MASAILTCYVDKLTKRFGGYEISVWRKVEVYIQNLKNKNNSYVSKLLKTQLMKTKANLPWSTEVRTRKILFKISCMCNWN